MPSHSETILPSYPGWIFRLSLPHSRVKSSSSSQEDEDNNGAMPEAPLLPNDGLSCPSISNNGGYLAELCPHGVSVTFPYGSDDSLNDNKIQTNKRKCQDSLKWSWSYSSLTSPSQWNVTSATLLCVTYRPSHEALPSYTNVSSWNRSLGYCARGCCGKCGAVCGADAGRNGKRQRWMNNFRTKPIHRVKVVYTVEDILHVEPIQVETATTECVTGGVWIRGIGRCHALRVYLRSKFGAYGPDGHGCAGCCSDEGITNIDGNQEEIGFEMPPVDDWDNLPSPPWSMREDKATDTNESSLGSMGSQTTKRQWGPILTFAIPHQIPASSSKDNGDDDGRERKSHAIHECPPLLWKVEHPPKPSVAVDCMTLMEGTLHLRAHPDITQNKPSSRSEEANQDNVKLDTENNLPETSSNTSYDVETPTNVYIHGYQSWSFSGSVVQGEPQPKSAMPSLLSEAFNRGGVVLSSPTCNRLDAFETWESEDEWCEGEGRVDATVALAEGRDIVADVDSIDEELNELTAFYKSDMFACISSNGATSRHDEDVVLLDEEGGPALIVGFLSQRKQFGTVLMDSDLGHFSLYACHEGLVAKRSLSTDWAYCQIVDACCYDEEAMVYYVHAVGDHNDARPMEKGLTTGWCSWYHYYSDIDHDSLARNAHILEQKQKTIGFNVCLIDDGYMTSWGDWTSLKPGKFLKDGGMRVLADAIRSKGMKPGVWLAPFACDKSSQLAKDHPDWIIRNDSGSYANSANCGKFFYGLDATNPAVRRHVYDTIRRAVDEWGFDVLKLDFLYASCLAGNGKYDNTMSRAEAMYLGLRTIRAAAKDAFIIGCGCPIGSAVGFVDGMRVSCDTGPTWVPEFPLPHWDNGTLPALRGMLRNTMSRAPFGHRWWHNDPDCILLGESTKLTDVEVVSAASIVAMTGGMFLLSDDMQKVSDRRLSVAKRIFPLTGVTAVPLDLHSTMNKGMPSVLRLWCTEYLIGQSKIDRTTEEENEYNASESPKSMPEERILKEQSSKLECEVGYSPGNIIDPYSRERSCFLVAPGLGTWTIVSLSNWMEHTARLNVSFATLVQHSLQDFNAMGFTNEESSPCEHSECGFHVFSFWSSEYTWIPHQTLVDKEPLIKRLSPHETEIFHIKPANPGRPQYIGSDLHFSCGFEVQSFEWGSSYINLSLKNDYDKSGNIFLYLPEPENNSKSLDVIAASVNGEVSRVEVIARPAISNGTTKTCKLGRVVKVQVSITGSQAAADGQVKISW